MKQERGFSLVEVLIVVAIIGIVTSIAVPALLASRRAANESAAVGNLRTIGSAESAYLAQTGQAGTFSNMAAARFLDMDWSNGVYRTGYYYTEVGINPAGAQFHFSAIPGSFGNGTKSYALIEDHVIRYAPGNVVLGSGSGVAIGA